MWLSQTIGVALRHLFREWSAFLKWGLLAVLVGCFVGCVGVAFVHGMRWVTAFRQSHQWVIGLLPIGGLLIVAAYHLSGILRPKGTNLVIHSVREGDELPWQMAPLIFFSTLWTHLLGGSAGREGAALQFGGAIAGTIGRLLRLSRADRVVIVMCGMSAAFSALFGTPITAAVLAMELANVGVIYYAALVPTVVSSIVAGLIATQCGLPSISFSLSVSESFSGFSLETMVPLLQIACLAALGAGVSVLFCLAMRIVALWAERFFPNQYYRIVVGGCCLVGLTLLFGTDYLGLGNELLQKAFTAPIFWAAFLLKILFTSVTLSTGYKGGEIVPAMIVGATFGNAMGPVLGLDPGFAAAIGLVSVFCGVTNAPITALLLAFEVFGFATPTGFLLTVAISYMLSGYYGLYQSQKIVWSKTEQRHIDRSAD